MSKRKADELENEIEDEYGKRTFSEDNINEENSEFIATDKQKVEEAKNNNTEGEHGKKFSEDNFNDESSEFIMMNKRKVEEIENDKKHDWVKNKFPKQESLDSDNEDDDEDGGNEENYVLSQDDIEGQEESGIRHDGDVPITPFNVEEEMEEGHFDTDGMYHWKKETLIKDNWLDNVDWIKIKSQGLKTQNESDSDSDEGVFFDALPLYKQILQYLTENETVSDALRRHGGTKSLSASERLKLKKSGKPIPTVTVGDANAVTKLTELANTVLSRTGNMDIYQQTFKDISKLINKGEKKKQGVNVNSTSDDLDMYADDFDSKEKARIDLDGNKDMDLEEKSDNMYENRIQWEYKIDRNSEKMEGPYSTEHMLKWKDEGYFKQRVWVRKYQSDGEFYSIDRVDFELYM